MRGIFLFVAVSHAIVAVCCLAFLFAQGSIRELASLDRVTFLLGGSFGVINFVCTVICIVGATYGSTTLLVSFANLGIVTLSTVYGLIFDPARNQLSVFVLLGLLTAVSVIVIHLFEREKGEKRETTAKGKWIYKLLCVGLFFINGLALVIYSLQTTHRPAVSSFSFIAVYSVVSALFALIAMPPPFLRPTQKRKRPFPVFPLPCFSSLWVTPCSSFWARPYLSPTPR
ncbi:MAG: hypothetical protein J6R89_00500 [Clostridia bacterium]|nr:hypothetical protein [Clostridia bacterium]